jgi:hypothetical protein
MAQNNSSQSNPNGSNPAGVDLLGQAGNNSDQFDHKDFSARHLKAVATIRQSITRRGSQPQ